MVSSRTTGVATYVSGMWIRSLFELRLDQSVFDLMSDNKS